MKVSVLLTAYKHGPYLRQAVESVLMQETDFDYEIVIGEDCSPDNTRAVAGQLAEEHPERIRLVLSRSNVGENRNIVQTLAACRGEFVAMLDGDDYWTSPAKLQKQVNFLRSRSDCSMCFHNAWVVYEDGGDEPHPFHVDTPTRRLSAPRPRPLSTLADIAPGNFIQTCSVMFRRSLVAEIPSWYHDLPFGDWPLYVLLAEQGKIGYLDEILGTYRVHQGGVWSSGMSLYSSVEDFLRMIRMYEAIDSHLGFRFTKAISQRSSFLYREAARRLAGAQKYHAAGQCARKYLRTLPLRRRLHERRMLRLVVRSSFPRVYTFLASHRRRWNALQPH